MCVGVLRLLEYLVSARERPFSEPEKTRIATTLLAWAEWFLPLQVLPRAFALWTRTVHGLRR